jgi:hypothetical protein
VMRSVQQDSREIGHGLPARLTPYLRQQYAEWFRADFHWDIFATFTFSHDLTSTRANAILGIYLRTIEEEVRAPLACLIAEERGPSRADASGRVHFHLLIHCAKPLDLVHLTDVWRQDCFGGDRTVGTSAVVRAYEKGISATLYMMKGLRDPKWGWSEWRLEGASKRKPKRFATSTKARRRWKRQHERTRQCAPTVTSSLSR